MTIQECYMALGGNYQEVAKRLPSESLVKRFITKFPDDKSFAELSQAMAEGDRASAFRAAHTLKGVSANLSLDQLLRSVVVLTELLLSLGVDEETARADACRMEHDISEITFTRIKEHMRRQENK